MVVLVILAGQSFSQQTLKVGEVRDGKFILTDKKALSMYFMNCLDNSGNLGKEFKSEASPDGDRYYVATTVEGNKDKVTAIGVLLVNKNNELLIVDANREDSDGPVPGVGGSMNVECSGAPCSLCFPELQWVTGQWYPLVRCSCYDPEGKCNSMVSFTINLQLGY